MMRFVVANYKSLDNPQQIRFGVILNDGSKTYYYFDTSTKRRDEISKLSKHFDKDTFKEFGNTFKEMFVDPGIVYDTDPNGIRRPIKVDSPEFLDYLHNSEGPYLYEGPWLVEGKDPNNLIRTIASQLLYQ